MELIRLAGAILALAAAMRFGSSELAQAQTNTPSNGRPKGINSLKTQQDKLEQRQKSVQDLESQRQEAEHKADTARSGKAQLGEDHRERRPASENGNDSSRYKLPFGLPTWEQPLPEPTLEPLFGNQLTSSVKGDERINAFDIEAGALVGMKGVPVLPANVGVFADIEGGATRGGHADITSKKDVNPQNPYQPTTATRGNLRYWGGGGLDVYLDSLRFKVGLEQGKIIKDGLKDSGLSEESLSSREHKSAIGVKVLGTGSGWFSYRDYKAYEQEIGRPTVSEIDRYLHVKFQLEFMDFDFDLGFGASQVAVYGINPLDPGAGRQRLGTGVSRTFRNTMTWAFSENWTNEFFVKYAYNADEGLADVYNALRLPTQPLNHPAKIQGTPEDFFNLWFFSGAEDVIEGLTLGFAYGMNIANFTNKSKGQKTDRFGGPIVEYIYDL